MDLKTGRERCVVELPGDPVVGPAVLSPNGHTLAAVVGARLQVWDVSRNPPQPVSVPVPNQAVIALDFAPDGNTLAGLCPSGPYLWSTRTWKGRAAESVAGTVCGTLAVSPDSQSMVATSTDSGRIFVYDLESGKIRRTYQEFESAGRAKKIVYSRDGRTLLVGGFWYGATLDLESGSARVLGELWPMAENPDGDIFSVYRIDMPVLSGGVYRRSKDLSETIWNPPGQVTSLLLTSDGRYLITNNANGTVYVLDLKK